MVIIGNEIGLCFAPLSKDIQRGDRVSFIQMFVFINFKFKIAFLNSFKIYLLFYII